MKTRAVAVTMISVLAAIVALSMVSLTVDVGQSDAQQTTCPPGTTLSEDDTVCLSVAVDDNVTTTTSCVQGVLSEDGKFCIVPRVDTPAPAAPGTATADAPTPAFTG